MATKIARNEARLLKKPRSCKEGQVFHSRSRVASSRRLRCIATLSPSVWQGIDEAHTPAQNVKKPMPGTRDASVAMSLRVERGVQFIRDSPGVPATALQDQPEGDEGARPTISRTLVGKTRCLELAQIMLPSPACWPFAIPCR
jgi:hypothetical protein